MALMAAYNRVNGVPATEHETVVDGIVKGGWASPGWSSPTSSPRPRRRPSGGLDVVLPVPFGPWVTQLVAAVRGGATSRAPSTTSVRRLLRLADRVGGLEGSRAAGRTSRGPDEPTRRDTLRRWAVAGMTVLRNEGALPLAAGTTVALLGVPARETLLDGRGLGGGHPAAPGLRSWTGWPTP